MRSNLAVALERANRPLIGTPHDLFLRHIGTIQSVLIEIEKMSCIETSLGVLDDTVERMERCVQDGVDLASMEHYGTIWSLLCQMAILKSPQEALTALQGIRVQYRDFARALEA